MTAETNTLKTNTTSAANATKKNTAAHANATENDTSNKKKPDKKEYQTAVYDLIYLIGCAVNEITPDKSRVEQMNLSLVYNISINHSLSSIACFALEDAYGGKLPAADLFRSWEEEKNQTIYRTLLFDAERRVLLSFLEESGIWYAQLKGILLKDLYPQMGMRQMSDNDIFFDKSQQEKVHDWFLARGYEAEDYKENHHDTYQKKPVYNFEMHTLLFQSYENPELDDYFENAADRLIPVEGTAYGRQFAEDDFYIYITAHTYKHYASAGSGLRSLVDCYVYNQAKGDDLNRTYIHDELAKMGMEAFEEEMRSLSYKLFMSPENTAPLALTEGEAEMLSRFTFAGTYGSIENRVTNYMNTMMEEGTSVTGFTKLKYLFQRLFPSPEFFKCNIPFFYRHKWLLPVGYVYRLIHRLFMRRRRLKEELKALKKL